MTESCQLQQHSSRYSLALYYSQLQRSQRFDYLGLLYGQLICYWVRISECQHSVREENRADRLTATHGASKLIVIDSAGADAVPKAVGVC